MANFTYLYDLETIRREMLEDEQAAWESQENPQEPQDSDLDEF